MVLEYCRDGDLNNYIKRKGRLEEPEAITILRQIAKGFAVTLVLSKGTPSQ